MKQCIACRYAFDKGGELYCRNGERYVQLCRITNGVQVLSAVPRLCTVINQHNDCRVYHVYRRTCLAGLRQRLMTLPGGNDIRRRLRTLIAAHRRNF